VKDGASFGLAGICENWKEPASGEWVRTFAIITTDVNELVADIHDRMPVILAPDDDPRWVDALREYERAHPVQCLEPCVVCGAPDGSDGYCFMPSAPRSPPDCPSTSDR
jgi:putative SOS response-associated peptidase YedK